MRAAGVPAVAATALHCVALAGGWPCELKTLNRAALIHSAGGGVGSMLIQICKIRGYSPIVAVVGSAHKIDFCRSLGADEVIDKSDRRAGFCLWERAKQISPTGYCAVFDANGVETIAQSLEHTAMCGRLVIYGFHSNIPKAKAFLDPLEWIGMIGKMAQMPKFDPMAMVLESKAVAGFNLSFFAQEHELIAQYMDQIVDWVAQGKLGVPDVQVFAMEDIAKAHEHIQSGKSVGKIVISV
jgi:NADPH:quinone reductase-like Zn-dependent oxidoreductase